MVLAKYTSVVAVILVINRDGNGICLLDGMTTVPRSLLAGVWPPPKFEETPFLRRNRLVKRPLFVLFLLGGFIYLLS